MIKFFRHIRKKLLTENKLSRYLFYAIGEIALVIIGILVALSVNNKNELRKEKAEEEKILIGIKNDFLTTRQNLLGVIFNQKMAVNFSKKLINLIEYNDIEFNTDSIVEYLNYGATNYYRSEPIIGTYDALIGSGNTAIIQNQKLLTSLAKFSAISKLPFEDDMASMNPLDLMEESISDYAYILEIESYREEFGANYRYTEQEKKAAIKQLFNNKSFLSHLFSKTQYELNRLERQQSLLGYAKDVLAAIGIKDIIISAEELQKYKGNYEEVNNTTEYDNFSFNLFVKENQLHLFTQGTEINLYPDSEGSFYGSFFESIKFDIENNNVVGGTILFKDDVEELKFKRVQE